MKLKSFHLILLSLSGGLLLSIGWPERGFPGFLFIGLVPFLIIEDHLFSRQSEEVKFRFLFLILPGFLLWNLLTTWWIVNSTLVGALLANILNSVFMSVVFQAFHWSRKKLKSRAGGYLALLSYWVAFEYLHLNWDLNWPWLNLGNGFAGYHRWVQWYEYTGAFGGTVWVIAGNILVAEGLRGWLRRREDAGIIPSGIKGLPWLPAGIFFTLWIILPVAGSLYIYHNYREEKRPVNFVVVQPNLDPYSEQYNLPPAEVVNRIMQLARPALDSNTSFLVAPESAIQENMWENDLSSFASLRLLRTELAAYPDLNMLVGGSTFYQLRPDEPRPRWARKFTDTDQYYVAYNTAILINNRDSLQLYHKSKLTPGVEILPSFKGFRWLERFAIDLGGTVGSLGMDSVRRIYRTVNSVAVGPAICYESIFGEFVSLFVKKGARIMIIITNDGWWGNTAGHRQHFGFARLRAIETRRSIARSANTGISALIDQRGDAIQQTKYWEPAVLRGALNANDRITFYTAHGDYIARFLTSMAGIIFLTATGIAIRRRYFRPRLLNQR